MKIGIISDGKYGLRTFEIIRKHFDTVWILVPDFSQPVLEEIDLNLPVCDMYISFVRHPDVAFKIVNQRIPTILGIGFRPGFLGQALQINPKVIAPITLCGLEDNSGIPAVDEYTHVFGKPEFIIKLDNDIIDSISILREAPCGATRESAYDLIGKLVTEELIRTFGLQVCHRCIAHPAGGRCNKVYPGILHARSLIKAICRTEEPNIQIILSKIAKEMDDLYLRNYTRFHPDSNISHVSP